MAPTQSEALPQIVLFGDSLTEWSFFDDDLGTGWYLQEMYDGKVKVLNEGHAGFTTRDVKPAFDRLMTRLTAPSAPRTLLITIFFGANDACILGDSTYVPLAQFEANIRGFVDAILAQLPDTKIVLISTPPINVPDPSSKWDEVEDEVGDGGDDARLGMGYLTYMSKKTFAETVMRMAGHYAGTGKVAGVDFWLECVNGGLKDQGREGEVVGSGKGEKYDKRRLPGCGLKGAKQFEQGWFTDGLHLGPTGYNALSEVLMDTVLNKWPELASCEL